MWLEKLLKDNKKIVIGEDIVFQHLEKELELPQIGEEGTFYYVRDLDSRYIWDNINKQYFLLIL